MAGREFRITIRGSGIECEIFTPGIKEPEYCEAKIQKEPYLETIKVLEKWLKQWQTLTRLQQQERAQDRKVDLLVPETFTLLGAHLWRMAFDNAIGAALLTHYQMIETGQLDYVRMRISIEKASDLAALPWEFVWYPGHRDVPKAFYLASEFKLILGRYVDGVTDREIPPADEQVRVLFVTSLPDDPVFKTAQEDTTEMIRRLEDGGRTAAVMEIERIGSWDAKRVGMALRRLARDKHHVDIVHLTALFRILEGQMQVYLPDPYAEGAGTSLDCGVHTWLPAITFVNVLTGEYKPTLLVLALSDWEGVYPEHFEQLAPDFINAGIPAVLAMQYPMSSHQGLAFLTSFYGQLTTGTPIGTAVQKGRRDMMLAKVDRNFGTPVLYMQSEEDAQLMTAGSPPDTDAETKHHTRGVVPSRKPTATRRSKTVVRGRLLDAIKNASSLLDPEAIRETSAWIESSNWPDVKAARLAIQERKRARKPDDAFQNIARYLAQVLGDETSEAAS
ncbi:hypothetical protein [Alloactinosynnema sp. L-07]|uniref:CHAT domain-containing protein n=1 Tax=Alloactinosynnema sp. L-07 TaxID=1653480 RepID=UPI00065EF9EF|nr:CHAT domain-containing protein [Alloactinosynnema sp. L-07]CRK59243.1 hypothetical protein [Alloactinosynnema sp. L-07]